MISSLTQRALMGVFTLIEAFLCSSRWSINQCLPIFALYLLVWEWVCVWVIGIFLPLACQLAMIYVASLGIFFFYWIGIPFLYILNMQISRFEIFNHRSCMIIYVCVQWNLLPDSKQFGLVVLKRRWLSETLKSGSERQHIPLSCTD